MQEWMRKRRLVSLSPHDRRMFTMTEPYLSTGTHVNHVLDDVQASLQQLVIVCRVID